ncbi:MULTISPECIES: hypothetical protein [Bacillus]|uniref:hypothetical protein n=1 Tax=Bacillus TaxID=1386 RepID=UPI00227FEBC3|nr:MULTISPECIES: hypothetical protein [Bacillus]MCY8099446.1 hypothetical protein [Bacillus haynesii]MCY9265982.1 hypothetical protein [Bacillus licheniformis]
MKTYKIAKIPMPSPTPEFVGFGPTGKEGTVEVKALNKQIAKSILACEIMMKHLSAGDGAQPIIVQALQNIVSIEEVHEDGRE